MHLEQSRCQREKEQLNFELTAVYGEICVRPWRRITVI